MHLGNPLCYGGIAKVGTTRTVDEMGAITRSMVRSSQESANAAWDYLARAQDLNTRLTQRAFETWLDALRRQAELSQDAAQEYFERAEEQADALQKLYGQWVGMFFGFPFSGFPHSGGTADDPSPVQRQGMRLVEAATTNASTATQNVLKGVETAEGGGDNPIENYDELTVDEVVQRLGSLSAEELAQVHSYEKGNKNRETLIREIERKMSFPVEGYDELNVGEISEQLDGLSVDELRTIRDYEKRNKDRETLLQEIERNIEAIS